MTNRGSRGQGGGGIGCTPIMIGTVLLVFVLLIGVANSLDEGAGWAVVVLGAPVVVLSMILLLVWPWAMNNLDRQSHQRDYQEGHENHLRELRIRDLGGNQSSRGAPGGGAPRGGRRVPGNQGGSESPQRYCTNCGAAARPDDRFCAACGHKLASE